MARKPRIMMNNNVTMKVIQISGLVDSRSKVIPGKRKNKPPRSSERNSRVPIFLPHLRHLPERINHETMGILSYHFKRYLQDKQTERAPSGFAPVSFKRRRRASQQRNEPRQAPIMKSKTRKTIFISYMIA